MRQRSEPPPEGGWDDGGGARPGEAAPAAGEGAVEGASRLAPPAAESSSPEVAPTARRSRTSPDLASELDLVSMPPAPAPELASEAPRSVVSAADPAHDSTAVDGPSPEAQEQLFEVLRAALDASLAPVLEKQKELESRLERLRELGQRTPAVGGGARSVAPAPRSVAPAPRSVAPAPLAIAPTASGAGARVAPFASMAPSLSVDVTMSVPPAAAKPSFVSTSYGLVISPPSIAPRPAIEVEIANVGPIEVPDFGSSRRAIGRLLVALLLAAVVAAIAATILSYT